MIPSWDTSYQSGPMYFIEGVPVSETAYRVYLSLSGRTHKQIERHLKELRRTMEMSDD